MCSVTSPSFTKLWHFINMSIHIMICLLRNLYGGSPCHYVTYRCTYTMRTVIPELHTQVSQNTVYAHHRRLLIDRCSAQTMIYSGYNDETVKDRRQPQYLRSRCHWRCCQELWFLTRATEVAVGGYMEHCVPYGHVFRAQLISFPSIFDTKLPEDS